MLLFTSPPVTPKQINYLRILFNDCGFSTRKQQLDFLILRNIDVNYLDQMTLRQASAVIEELKELKNDRNQAGIDQEEYFDRED